MLADGELGLERVVELGLDRVPWHGVRDSGDRSDGTRSHAVEWTTTARRSPTKTERSSSSS